jgi:flagellar hook assembly protein FlgD
MVRVSVYDVGGRVIRAMPGRPTEAGEHSITWDGRSADGVPVRSGLYFMRLVAGERTVTRRIVVER